MPAIERLLLDRVLPALDRVGRLLALVAMVLVLVLIGVMIVEVVARRFLNAPTIWANDVTYMTNGTIFLLAAAWTLRRDAHVRIDVLSSRLPARIQHAINLAFYLLVFLPALWLTCNESWTKAWRAYLRGTRENMSTWEPLIWPFLAGITLGVVGLTLQVAVESVRHAIGIKDPLRVPPPGGGAREARA